MTTYIRTPHATMVYNCCGLFVIEPNVDYYRPQNLVALDSVHVEAVLVDTVAEVRVTQNYVNRENRLIEAEYMFPLDSRAAVCGFEATIADRKVVGVAKEKKEAKKEYDAAIRRGDGAYLLEQEKSDIFRAKVGNVPPGESVGIHIKYVVEMKNEEDQIRFVLPTTIAPRYNAASSYSHWTCWRHCGKTLSSPPTSSWVPYKLSINASVHMLSNITAIESTTHSLSTSLNGATASVGLEFGDTVMDRDLVINIATAEPHKPRVTVEDDGSSSYAAMVTLMPRFKFQDVPIEAIFVLDRSGSMGGSQIQEAQKALQLFMRSLPEVSSVGQMLLLYSDANSCLISFLLFFTSFSQECYFNIVGFGSRFVKLFSQSMKYSDETLSKATQHISKVRADLGGTEIYAPLNDVLKAPAISGYPRQVFVLTDGQISNNQQVFNLIQENQSRARVFSLGIGNSVSHDLVEGIASHGKGTAAFVIPGERMESKIMKQLQRAIQPALSEVKIDWGCKVMEAAKAEPSAVGGMAMSLLGKQPTPRQCTELIFCDVIIVCTAYLCGVFAGYVSPNAAKPASAPSRQAPFITPPVFDHERFVSYCLIGKGEDLPATVKISAKSPEGPLNVELPLCKEQIIKGKLIHTLAARTLIRDLEDGTSFLHLKKDGSKASTTNLAGKVREEIIRLGIDHQLASAHTSFVAIEERSGHECDCFRPYAHQLQPAKRPVPQQASQQMYVASSSRGRGGGGRVAAKKMKKATTYAYNGAAIGAPPPPSAAAPMPQFMSHSAAEPMAAQCMPQRNEMPVSTQLEVERMCDFDMSADDECGMEEKEELQKTVRREKQRKSRSRCRSKESVPVAPGKATASKDLLSDLVLLQRINGSFPLGSVCRLLSISIDSVRSALAGNSDDAIGTALALCAMETLLGTRKEDWMLVGRKAETFLIKNKVDLGVARRTLSGLIRN